MVEIVLSYGNLTSFLIVIRICGGIFLRWPYSGSVYFRISCLSERFPCTRSLGNFHLHTLWEADFCVCWVTRRRMEIYVCVPYLRRLFSECHLHVRGLFSLEHRISPFVFKTKNQRVPSSVLRVRIKNLNKFHVSGSQNCISASLSLTCVPNNPLESEG